MKRREKVDYATAIIILIIAISGLSISCMALSNSIKILKVQGVAGINSSDWNVYFDNLTNIKYEGTAVGIIDPIIDNGTTKISTFEVQFNNKNDTASYLLDVINDSNVDAKVESIIQTDPICSGLYENAMEDASLVCKNFKYKLTYKDGTDVKVGDILNSNSSQSLKLSMWYEGNTWPINNVQVYNLSISLYYTQK